MSLAFATQVSLVMGFGQNFFEVLTEGGYHLDHFLGVDGFFFFPLFFSTKSSTTASMPLFQNIGFKGGINANLWITL